MDTSVMEQPVEKTELNSLDIARILECLPHRYPFLMIDRIINMNGDDSAVGVKNVTFNEPIFPGVLIIEGMAQTAGATVIAHDAKTGGGKSIVLLLTIDKAKFRKPAEPGDRIEYHIRKIQRRRSVGRYEAKAMVDGTVIAEAEIGAMIVGE